MKLSVKEVLEATGGVLIMGSRDARLGEISTDTRALKPGQTFLALKGQRLDGHRYIRAAVKKGAKGLIVSIAPSPHRIPESVVVIHVRDTLRALGDLAACWRRKLGISVVAITGSNGKTTTKEMTAAALSARYRTAKNPGNLNNLVGLPLSIFMLDRGCDAAVLEMGTNHPGEIARLTEIASPDVGLITNTGPVHLEGLKTIAGVISAKSELVAGLEEEAAFVLNLEERGIRKRAERFKGRLFGFSAVPEGGLRKGVSVHLASLEAEVFQGRPRVNFYVQEKLNGKPRGRPVKLWVAGLNMRNAVNAAAAIAAARALGVPLSRAAERICGFQVLSGRGGVYRTRGRAIVIDDTYNANPVSVRIALENLRLWKKGARTFAALGEMRELGAKAGIEHRKIGALVGRTGVDFLFVRGEHANHVRRGAVKAGMDPDMIRVCKTNRDMAARIKRMIGPGDWVLVKGSRKMAMEEVVKELVRGGRCLI